MYSSISNKDKIYEYRKDLGISGSAKNNIHSSQQLEELEDQSTSLKLAKEGSQESNSNSSDAETVIDFTTTSTSAKVINRNSSSSCNSSKGNPQDDNWRKQNSNHHEHPTINENSRKLKKMK